MTTTEDTASTVSGWRAPEAIARALELAGLSGDGLVHGCGCGRPHPPARSALDVDPGRWRRIRVNILARDHYACRVDVDGAPCGERASVAGHVYPRHLGGCDRPLNLRAECRRHSSVDGAQLGNAERRALELARVLTAHALTESDDGGFSGGSSDPDPAMKVFSLSDKRAGQGPVSGAAGMISRSTGAIDASTFAVPGPDDPLWDDCPWLSKLRIVPEGATWPRLMSYPHPRAVGTYGPEALEAHGRLTGGGRLRWWQRLAVYRILEHDADGVLVWAEVVDSTARQLGKSVKLRALALQRVLKAPARWGTQTVLHTGRELGIVREILLPAWSWAEQHGLDASRNNLNPGIATGPHMTGSRWLIRAKNAAYGLSPGLALVDEGWDVPGSTVDEGIEPTIVEQTSPQLVLFSTAHRKATGMMIERRAAAIAEIADPGHRLILEWSAPAFLARDDPRAWRAASPHWTPNRERLVRAAYEKVMRGISVDPEEPDPVESFDAQWLNRWPDVVTIVPKTKDEPLLLDAETVEGAPASPAWRAALDERAEADPAAALFLAVEDELGAGSSAAAGALTPDGRVVIGGWRFATRREAVDWCQDIGEGALDPLLLVGASFVDDPELEGLEIPVEPAGAAETRTGLPLLRELVRTGRIAHDGGRDTSDSVLTARVKPGTAGAAMLLTGNESTALVRCLAWVAQRAWRERA